ncbi:acyl carrier protein [Chitiniphilus eburneus]|uniref:Acyl carrier protein n=1 Tax=Chitiniphilus eburneus TaxID=2571148 RepID=A0A4U0Q8S6_9NEIS|nr:acyl carrier protein [Chitiniphilus eburneus]TJZ77669.1 acyl carrier protein [Chitiniphilus eburneus]
MNATQERIVEICLQVIEMDRAEIGLNDEFRSFAHIDSLKSLDLMTALEREFKLKLPEAELREFETIAKVIAVVERYLPETVAA